MIKKNKDSDVPGLGLAFVYYDRIDSAKDAQENLCGRRFQGRIVITSFYPEKKFKEVFLNVEN